MPRTGGTPPVASIRDRPIIALTTDFGLADHYVGVLHAVVLSINRAATVVDLCHVIPPQDVAAGSFVLGAAWRYFPPDTIHVVVVDPGVGGDRPVIVVRTPGGTFVAPDNGVLSAVLRHQVPDLPLSAGRVPARALGPAVTAVRLTNSSYWLPGVSTTFHGRDIFAPVAAHLSAGLAIDELGEPAASVLLLPASRPVPRPDGTIVAHVVYVDRFGNLVTDLDAQQAAALPQPLVFHLRGRSAPGLFRFYAEGPELMAVAGSSGQVEISLRHGSAAEVLGARVGDEVEVTPGSQSLSS